MSGEFSDPNHFVKPRVDDRTIPEALAQGTLDMTRALGRGALHLIQDTAFALRDRLMPHI